MPPWSATIGHAHQATRAGFKPQLPACFAALLPIEFHDDHCSLSRRHREAKGARIPDWPILTVTPGPLSRWLCPRKPWDQWRARGSPSSSRGSRPMSAYCRFELLLPLRFNDGTLVPKPCWRGQSPKSSGISERHHGKSSRASGIRAALNFETRGYLLRTVLCCGMSSRYELARIAETDLDFEVRIAAVHQLRSSDSRYELERIAENDLDARVRFAAVQRLSSHDSRYKLEKIAQKDDNSYVRVAAVKNLPPHDSRYTLEKIAESDSNAHVRIAATEHLPSHDSRHTLERVAENDSDDRVRLAAVQNLPSHDSRYTLERIAVKDESQKVRIAAIKKLR
jgi:hypothetical protein